MSAGTSRKGQRDTLLVGNLERRTDPDETASELKREFERFGMVEECNVMRTAQGASRGFAFVKLRSPMDAAAAKAALDNTRVGSSNVPIRVRYVLDTATLFVGDLGPNVKHEELSEAFKQFGTVVNSRIEFAPPELGGRSKQYGFVEFSKRAVAAKVQQLLAENLFVISSSPRPVRVEFALDAALDQEPSGKPISDMKDVDPPPHFASPGTLEFDFALRWRELQLAHKAEEERLAEVHRQEREVLRQEQVQVYRHAKAKFHAVDNPEATLQRGVFWSALSAEQGGAFTSGAGGSGAHKRARS